MGLRNEFLTALRGGEDCNALMELICRHRAGGLPLDAAYEALHEIWLEHGFDTTVAEQGALQDTLETVMEKVWYGQHSL